MTEREVERFFSAAASRCTIPASILMIGGAAAVVMSEARATTDFDLEIQVQPGSGDSDADVDRIIAALEYAGRVTGYAVQASTTIERWSMIGWGDYRAHTTPWKVFGTLTVVLLEPEYFAHTKLLRYSAVDISDIRKVLSGTSASWKRLAEVSGRALRAAPRSTAQATFRLQVEHFFRTEGPTIWTTGYRSEDAVRAFQRAAGLQLPPV